MRVVARQAATVVGLRDPARRLRPPDGLARRRACGGLGPAAARRRRSPSTSRSATAPRPSSMGAGDLLQPRDPTATTCSSTPRRLARPAPARASRCSTPASPSASARGRRSPSPCCAARASARATSTSSARSRRQPRLEVRLALLLWHLAARWGRVEPGGIRLSLPAHPSPARAARRAPSARRSRTRSRASPRPGSSPAAPTSGTCTARVEHHLACARRTRDARRRATAPRSPRPPDAQLMLRRRVHPRTAAQRAAPGRTSSG